MRERFVAGSAVEGRCRLTDGFCDVRKERSGLLAEGLGGRGRLRGSLRGLNAGGEGGNDSSIRNEGEDRETLVSSWRGDMGRSEGSEGNRWSKELRGSSDGGGTTAVFKESLRFRFQKDARRTRDFLGGVTCEGISSEALPLSFPSESKELSGPDEVSRDLGL